MCGRPQQGLECLGGRRNACNGYWLGPGNTNVPVLPLPCTHPVYPTTAPMVPYVGVTGQHEGYTGPRVTGSMHI